MVIYTISIIFAFVFSSLAFSSEKVKMFYFERPPYYMTVNQQPQGLILGPALEKLAEAPNLTIKPTSMNSSAIIPRLKHNAAKECSIGWFKNPEWEKWLKFSKSIYQDKPLVMVTSSDKRAKFSQIKTIQDLFENKALVWGKTKNFSYGAYTDSLAAKKQPKIKLLTKQKNLLKVLALKTEVIDYILMAPEEIPYILSKFEISEKEIFTQSLTDIPKGNKRYIVCTKMVPDKVMAQFSEKLGIDTQGKHLKLVVGLALPPYIITEESKTDPSGIEYELVKEAFKQVGYTVEATVVPLKAVPYNFEKHGNYAALTLSQNFKFRTKVYFSEPYIVYQNFAISLASNNLRIDNIESLKNYSIASFQNASIYLGNKFGSMVKANQRYKEFSKQVLQNRALYSGRVQVVVGDKNIFQYYNSKIKDNFDVKKPVVFSPIFPPNNYVIAFKDKTTRDDFNKGLKAVKASGLSKRLKAKYLPEAI